MHAIRTCLTVAALTLAPSFAAAQFCQPIQFERGSFSGAVSDTLTPSQARCYTLEVGSGQAARIAVIGENMCVSVSGVGDCQAEFRFTTRAGIYELRVTQLFRSASTLPFTLTAEVR
ncbi:MAG: hypothetical protein AAFR53_06835 [Pseudomonadota bacterium]